MALEENVLLLIQAFLVRALDPPVFSEQQEEEYMNINEGAWLCSEKGTRRVNEMKSCCWPSHAKYQQDFIGTGACFDPLGSCYQQTSAPTEWDT